MGSKMGVLADEFLGDGLGSALTKYLAKAEAMGRSGLAVGKGALEAVPGLARDNPRLAMAAASMLGGGAGYEAEHLSHPDEEEIRKEDDLKWIRRMFGHEGEEE